MKRRDCDGGAISYSKSRKRKVNGCMAAFYHLFDFHHFYFSSHHHLTIHSPPSSSKSLKIIEETLPSTTYKDTQSFNIPPVSMRVRTEIGTRSSRLRALATDTLTSSSEICNSPSSKTPNLVARLMGLDLLPDKTNTCSLQDLHTMSHHGTSRLSSHRLSKKGTRSGTRSLPESPRISSARKSDFDIHRLSLQLNKENNHQEFGCSKLKQYQSPRDYAKQIVKQIKERVVTRRVVGTDITNSVRNNNELRRDTTVSCSPRSRFSDKENKPNTIHKTNTLQSSLRPEHSTQKPKPTTKTTVLVSVSNASEEKQKQKKVKQRELRPINRCNKAENEPRFTQRLVKPSLVKPSLTANIRIKQRHAFLSESTDAKTPKKKPKKISNSNDINNILPTKPHKTQQSNETQQTEPNENASFCSTLIHVTKENSPKVARAYNLDDSEEDYITRIINIYGTNTITMLNPSIFRKLEHSGENPSGPLSLRCNRRLMFDLVSEILMRNRRKYHGSELIREVCSAVARYRESNEEVGWMEVGETKKKVEEEGEEMAAEIERDLIDALVLETVSELRLIKRNRVVR